MTKIKLYYLLIFFFFFSNFYTSLFGVLSNKFEQFQNGCDNLIFGRIILSEKKSVFYEGGLSGFFGIYCERDLKKIYLDKQNQNIKDFDTYRSQLAFQGVIFSIIDSISPFSKEFNLSFFYFITTILSSLSLTFFIVWIKEEFNIITSFFTSIFIFGSLWIIIFSKSLWWCLWSFYFPFVSLLFFLKRPNNLSQLKLFKTVFFWFFIKCIFSGYEYITTAVIMCLIPILFYGILGKWSLRKIIKTGLTASLAIVLSIIISLTILIYKISNLNINPMNGFDYIVETFLRRSQDDPNKYSGLMYESMNCSILEVIKMYINFSIYSLKINKFQLSINILHISVALFIISIILFFLKFKTENKKLIPLIITLWVSSLAPFSWIIIFKGHSYIHIFMNSIIWYMPFLLLGFILMSHTLSTLLKELFFLIKKTNFDFSK